MTEQFEIFWNRIPRKRKKSSDVLSKNFDEFHQVDYPLKKWRKIPGRRGNVNYRPIKEWEDDDNPDDERKG